MSLSTNLSDLATRIATELKAHKVLINGNAADLSGLSTTAKTSLVAAINEVVASIASGGGAAIDDSGTSSSSVWSSDKTSSSITSAVSAAVSGLVNAAPSALDTLKELADALGDDADFAATVTTELAGKSDVGHTHTSDDITDATTVGKAVLTAANAAAARTAIGAGTSSVVIGTTSGTAADAALVGDTTTDFVTTFESGLS
jgi:hypothetical protein